MNVKEWVEITCQINGKTYQFCVSPAMSLLELLREHGLTSVKQGCCVGECGACSVLIDDIATDSCLYLALWADGKQITTAEGLGKGETLSPIQKAYIDAGAVQCGFCTPGLVVATHALLAKPHNRPLTHEEIRRGLSGNLCRCTGYQAIVRAVDACQQSKEEEAS